MRPCCCQEHDHWFVDFEGEQRCQHCDYYEIELLEHTNIGSQGAGGNCLTCGVRWPCPFAGEKS